MNESDPPDASAEKAPYSLRLELEVAAFVVEVHDFSWPALAAVQDALAPLLLQRGVDVRLDLREMDAEQASAVWVAGMVSLARRLRRSESSLTVVAPPPALESLLRRVRLTVESRAEEQSWG